MAPEVRFNAFGIPYLVEFANVTFRRSRSRTGSTSTSHLSTSSDRHDRRSASSSLHKPSLPSLRRLHPSASVATFDSDWTILTASSETLAAPSVQYSKPLPKSKAKSDPQYDSISRAKAAARAQYQAMVEGTACPSPLLSPTSKPLPEITVESEIETEGEGLLIRFTSQLAAHEPPHKLSHNRLARLKYRIAKAVVAAGMDSSPASEAANPMEGRRRTHSAATGMSAREQGAYRASFCSIRSEEVETRGMPSSLFRGTYGQVMAALTAAGLTAAPCKESGVQNATRLGALFVARQDPHGGVEFTKVTLWA
ncbi:hypothetical protein C8Q74DRAFT_1364350 [Fomes fomentarius]|nr:hypothetical protein C8Q74DRAFT_1364350 [Fomes fomentarius]